MKSLQIPFPIFPQTNAHPALQRQTGTKYPQPATRKAENGANGPRQLLISLLAPKLGWGRTEFTRQLFASAYNLYMLALDP